MVDDLPEPGGLDPLELRAWRGLIEVTPLLQRHLDRLLMADSGLSGSDYPVLVALHERGEPALRSTQLADLIGWEQSRLSHHLARMESRGLVVRSRHRSDNRVAEVRLTEHGRATFRRAAKQHSQAVRTHFAEVLSSAELEALATVMETIKNHLDTA
ncbi:MarR family winged helix-turn-helix transcriptional regulator [Paractinoplanes ferrugineus]|uniref:MarR family transcriptional regulator n=1 Tax=Paractinoplanes ferrugineus TaxID=113564 RepID=A0A919MCQ9_9ACTN|nr:MarR family winged helix-turn-helix transcriptional regulator [Actinoplanes ferrugineus]GIE14986.1 MarR family transcriptional regulator [Actinoplanes ferrugineus]